MAERKLMRPSAVIPARYGASRFPGKPLATLAGRPLVQHVWERAMKSEAFERVLVATDDDRIEEAVRRFGGEVVRTSASCPSGTDRVAEVARAHPEVSHWVNVQGDEPLIATSSLQALAELVVQTRDALCTLVRPLKESERQVPHVVKAVVA
ncbi:MAG TPA: NTP transferase domain-containing protein, partial [Myxococcaceae bacterium]|nr:NTP transferase domain-containing protein [Myxococcaceae bacterium]